MSILRQLLLSIAAAIAVLLIGAQALGITASETHFHAQMKAHSTAGAAMLATALANPATPRSNWSGLAEAVFQHGRYARLRIQDAEGATVADLVKPPAAAGPPAWFAAIVPLAAVHAAQPFSRGDTAGGVVEVYADVVPVRAAIWRISLGLALAVLAVGLVWVLVAIAQVRWLEKRLLRGIGSQVRALAHGQANPAALPALRELADVADALEEAREHFRVTAEENSARIESLQLELNLDPVTRLPNRKYFFNELRRVLNAQPAAEAQPGGHVLMFRQRDLAQINRHMPRDLTDQWLRSLGHRLDRQLGRLHRPPYLLARLNGSDFILLLPQMDSAGAATLAQALRHELRALRLSLGEGRWCRWAIALARYERGIHASDLMARLDHALMCAESADSDTVFDADTVPAPDYGSEGTGEHQWRDTLVMALEQHRFSLDIAALRGDGTVLRHEATLMLHEGAGPDPIAAQVFMPAAIRLGLSAECDVQAARLALDWLVSHTGKLAIRLALPSLEQPDFLARLGQMLRDRPAQAARLSLEIDARGLVEHYTSVRALCQITAGAGSSVGVCRLAEDFGAMRRLHQLPIAYLKLGSEFAVGLAHSPGSRQLAASVMETARALNIEVYADDVRDDRTRSLLEQIGLTLVQTETADSATATIYSSGST